LEIRFYNIYIFSNFISMKLSQFYIFFSQFQHLILDLLEMEFRNFFIKLSDIITLGREFDRLN